MKALRSLVSVPKRRPRGRAAAPVLGAPPPGDAHAAWEAELQEFLAADHEPLRPDPCWKEDLRDRLWEMLQTGQALERVDLVAETSDFSPSPEEKARA